MNIYCIVEGECEKKVYPTWIKHWTNSLQVVDCITQVSNDCVYIISAMGYPRIFEMIRNGITDVNSYGIFDRLVISVDSEESTYEEKLLEIQNEINKYMCNIEVYIIIEHFCLETWALGNQTIIRRNTENPVLQEYMNLYNVTRLDPENLPNYPKEGLNRAQFALKYLHKAINDVYTRLTYSKSNPMYMT